MLPYILSGNELENAMADDGIRIEFRRAVCARESIPVFNANPGNPAVVISEEYNSIHGLENGIVRSFWLYGMWVMVHDYAGVWFFVAAAVWLRF